MIEGFIGRPGSGKTYTLTERVLRASRSGRKVFTNYPVAAPNVYLFGPHELLKLPAGLVVIDEAHLWFPSRMSLRLPSSWMAGLSQTRKNGWDLLWCAQHETRVDRALRDVTSWMWLCRSWGWSNGHPIGFSAKSWEPEFFRGDKRGRGPSSWRFYSRGVADAYDTVGRIAVASHAVQANDPYADPADLPAPRPGARRRRESPVVVP